MFDEMEVREQLHLLVTLANRVLALTDDREERRQIIKGIRRVQQGRYNDLHRTVSGAVGTVSVYKAMADEIRAERNRFGTDYQSHYPAPSYDPEPEQS